MTSPNSIFFEKNYNSGGVVANETAANARTAHVRILRDAQHASALDVPFIPSPLDSKITAAIAQSPATGTDLGSAATKSSH